MIWTDSELHAIDMMRRYGGSFVNALAALCMRADAFNAGRLRSTFSDYFTEYGVKK